MQWITAVIAFAATMLVFAIIASSLVEMVHRLFNSRSGGLEMMLTSLYEQVIRPHQASLVNGDDPEGFIAAMMGNRATRVRTDKKSVLANVLPDAWTTRDRVAELPVEIFTQKLAALWKKPAPGASIDDDKAIVDNIAQHFEAFGREASMHFESKARFLSVLISIVLAWSFYLHPYQIFTTYIKNPDVAKALADQAVKITAEYDALTKRLESERRAGGAADVDRNIAALKEEFAAANDRLKELSTTGVPLGWPVDAKPCAEFDGSRSEVIACRRELWGGRTIVTPPMTTSGLSTLLWLTLGGLLAGLGAPFWARAVTELSQVSGFIDKISSIVGVAPKRQTVALVSPAASPPAQLADASSETFKLALETRKPSTP